MRCITLALLLAIAACAPVPITGREQLSLVSDSAVMSASDQEFSKFIANARQKGAVLTASESPQAAAVLAMVQRAGTRIIDAAGLAGARNWEIHVVKSKAANAFVTPNGKIVVFTGLLVIAQNEAALAGVLGHEVGHVIARHAAERMSQVVATNIAIATATVAAGVASKDARTGQLVGAAVGLGLQYGVLLPYSREHESEADHIGMFLAAKAGYDPAEYAAMWRRMDARSQDGKWEFGATHPSAATRYTQITEWLPEAMLYYGDPRRPLPASLAEVQVARARHAEASALAPLGAKPAWDHGLTFQLRTSEPAEHTVRVEHRTQCPIPGPCIALVFPDDEVLYTEDYAVIESGSRAALTRYDPPLINARFPLRVGDTWSQQVTRDAESRKSVMTTRGDVVAYESVTVPAGTFMAFKIVLAANGARFREIWWAPEARFPVRVITHNTRSGRPATIELVAIPRTDDPAAVIEAATH